VIGLPYTQAESRDARRRHAYGASHFAASPTISRERR